MNDNIVWNEENRKIIHTCPVFSVTERFCRSPDNVVRAFTVLETRDWAIVIPLLENGEFVMVRQWRPGAGDLSLEFPGGVCNDNEKTEDAAARELMEETGYSAGKLIKLGVFNPNPAIMSNKVHFFLAEDLKGSGKQKLDDDEFVNVETKPMIEVIDNMGKPPYIHALMGTALALFHQHIKKPEP